VFNFDCFTHHLPHDGKIMAPALLDFGFFTYRSPHHGSKI